MPDQVTAIYTRLSKVDLDPESGEVRQSGLITQQEECSRYAAFKGWENVRVYEDAGRSGFREVRRPRFTELERDIRAGDVHAVLFWKIDRCYRNLRRLLEFIELCEAHGVTFCATSQGIDTSIPGTGKLLISVLGAIAEAESQIKSDRMRAKRDFMKRTGRPRSGGSRQFGYEPDNVTERPGEVRLIQRSADALVSGSSLRGIWKLWYEAGVRNSKGVPVDPTTIRKVLLSGRFLSPAVAERVRVILSDPSRRTNRLGANRKAYLLVNRAVCGRCGRRLLATRTTKGVKIYACRGKAEGGCNGVKVRQEQLDSHVAAELDRTGFLPYTFTEPDATNGEEAALGQSLKDDEARIQNLTHGLVNDAASKTTVRVVNAAIGEIESRMTKTRLRLGEISRERAGINAWTELIRNAPIFDFSDFDRLKLLIETAVKEVRVHTHPGGKGFKASRVEIVAADGAAPDPEIIKAWELAFEG